jgi:outer membrane protein assembly factor BamB
MWSADSRIRAGTRGLEVALIYDERGIYALGKTGAAAYTDEGTPRWTMPLPDAVSIPALDDEGILYAGGSDWVLNAYHMEDIVKPRRQPLYSPARSYLGPPAARYEPGEIGARLERIAAVIGNGQVGERERSYAAFLMEIAGSRDAAPVKYRVEAARLLSYIGSRETIPFLATLCRNDPDTVVKAAAAEAIGVIGVDPDGMALAVFTALVFPQIPGRDERVMASIAAATGALCRFSGPPLSQEGTHILTAIASLGPRFAQAVARRELQSLIGD